VGEEASGGISGNLAGMEENSTYCTEKGTITVVAGGRAYHLFLVTDRGGGGDPDPRSLVLPGRDPPSLKGHQIVKATDPNRACRPEEGFFGNRNPGGVNTGATAGKSRENIVRGEFVVSL